MKKEFLLYIAILFIISGLALTCMGIGKIFDRSFEGVVIGIGSGLTISAFTLLKTFRRRDAYEKK
jgi:hypothetical protein